MRLIQTKKTRLSRYATLVERIVDADGGLASFHALEQSDYANVLAVTDNDEVALVRQYRPVIDDYSLELPGGLLDPGETADAAVVRELYEETGLCSEALHLVGKMQMDPGRLINTAWGYVALGCTRDPKWQAEGGTETSLIPRKDYYRMILHGEFTHGFHIAISGLALMHGLLPPPDRT